AHVMVMDSPIIRGIVTAVAWLRPSASPQYATATLAEAVERAVACLAQRGIRVGPDVIARAGRAIEAPESLRTAGAR
ncbi:MAG TPA: hypothetical protein VFZ61_00470, partial [Polyangiales bacterium]